MSVLRAAVCVLAAVAAGCGGDAKETTPKAANPNSTMKPDGPAPAGGAKDKAAKGVTNDS